MMKKSNATKRPGIPKESGVTDRRMGEPEDFLVDRPVYSRPETPGREREQLGKRIRKVREERGLTLKDISSRTGIDVDVIKRVESSEITPPLGQLVRLSKALDMKMGYFISPGVDKPMTIVRADKRPRISRHGEKRSKQSGYLYEALAPEKGNRLMEPFMVTLLPTEQEDFSTHEGQEFIFVLRGGVKVQVGKQAEFLHPGDAVYYDSNQPHLVKSTGGKKARILAVLYTESR